MTLYKFSVSEKSKLDLEKKKKPVICRMAFLDYYFRDFTAKKVSKISRKVGLKFLQVDFGISPGKMVKKYHFSRSFKTSRSSPDSIRTL